MAAVRGHAVRLIHLSEWPRQSPRLELANPFLEEAERLMLTHVLVASHFTGVYYRELCKTVGENVTLLKQGFAC